METRRIPRSKEALTLWLDEFEERGGKVLHTNKDSTDIRGWSCDTIVIDDYIEVKINGEQICQTYLMQC